MNYRQTVEQKILFILLTYNKELISDNSAVSTFDIIRKHAVVFEDFSDPAHQVVFKAILNQMHSGALQINPVTLVSFRPQDYKVFEQQSNEFLQLIVNLKNTGFAAFSELDQLIYKLKEFVLSDFWRWSAQTGMSTNFEAINVIQYGENMISKYNGIYSRMTNGIISVEHTADDMASELRKKMENAKLGIYGAIPIHVKSIQNILHGLNAPDFIVIGARPSMGKTETGLAIAWEASQTGKHVVFLSIEMSEVQLTNKIVTSLTGIETDKIKQGNLTMEEYTIVEKYYRLIKSSTFNLISGAYRVLEKLVQKVRELHKMGKIDLLVIDYLQLMKTLEKISNRDQYIGHITAELKALCLELMIPIIALSQLKRASVGKQPTLEDLRESGSIEQDADIVAFVHRQAFYAPNYDSLPYNEQFTTEFIVRKHRGGSLGTATYFQDVIASKVYDI